MAGKRSIPGPIPILMLVIIHAAIGTWLLPAGPLPLLLLVAVFAALLAVDRALQRMQRPGQPLDRQLSTELALREGARAESIMREHSRIAQRNLRDAVKSHDLDQMPGVGHRMKLRAGDQLLQLCRKGRWRDRVLRAAEDEGRAVDRSCAVDLIGQPNRPRPDLARLVTWVDA